MTTLSDVTTFQLRQLMGGGSWADVYQSKEEDDYCQEPNLLTFASRAEAEEGIAARYRCREHVRIVTVRTIRTEDD